MRLYHAVRNYYLKYSWECLMQSNTQNLFLYCGHPEYSRSFSVVCWSATTGREFPNIFPYLGVHIRDTQAPPNKYVCRNVSARMLVSQPKSLELPPFPKNQLFSRLHSRVGTLQKKGLLSRASSESYGANLSGLALQFNNPWLPERPAMLYVKKDFSRRLRVIYPNKESG